MSRRPEPGTPSPSVRVGNDVVDLRHPRCRTRPEGDRLPRRILTPEEARWREGPVHREDRLRRLWSLWAAKEAAFKIASKLRGAPPVFRHRDFEASLEEDHPGTPTVKLHGVVRWEGLEFPLEGLATREFVHVAGYGGDPDSLGDLRFEMGVEGHGEVLEEGARRLRRRASGREGLAEDGTYGPLSRRARQVARARLAEHVGGENGPGGRIRIVTDPDRPGRSPPRVLVDGEHRPDLELSLSHHGRYVAWAFLVPRRPHEAGADRQNPGR
jgi:phosphopantetheine--protein transferase-like protein